MVANSIKNETKYFKFEDDFIEDNVRCIPMIVRFKLDAVGIKLKLAEWSRLQPGERSMLAEEACTTAVEIALYRSKLQSLVRLGSGHDATEMEIDLNPAWANLQSIDPALEEKAREYNWEIS